MSMNNFCPVISSSFFIFFFLPHSSFIKGGFVCNWFPLLFPTSWLPKRTGREGIFDIPQERVVFLGVSIYKFAFFGYRFFLKNPLSFSLVDLKYIFMGFFLKFFNQSLLYSNAIHGFIAVGVWRSTSLAPFSGVFFRNICSRFLLHRKVRQEQDIW